MYLALEAVPISALKTGPNQVVEKIAQQPLLLTQHGRSVAVMVSPQQWNDLITQLSQRRFTEAEIRAIAKAYQKRAEGMEYETMEDLKARIAEHDRVAGKA